uniref:Uncharacterized protein n=1 Tax=Nymphaea colorata TaxID=210225 RepID=A0A5K0W9I4_9MAGN
MTLTNAFPWITTVGAGSMVRTFAADVLLGNGRTIPGVSLYAGGGSSPPRLRRERPDLRRRERRILVLSLY